MNKLTFTLSGLQNAGQVADLRKDFNIYAKSQQNILVNVLVPKSLIGAEITNQYFDTDGSMVCENGIYTALKMGMVFMRNDGKIGKTQSYYLRYIKTIVNRFGEFYLYERLLPREFTRVAGVGVNAPKFVFNVVNIANNIVVDEHGETIVNEPTVVSLFTTQICRLDVLPSTELDQDPEAEASEFDLLSAEVNSLLAQSGNNAVKAETVLKYDISSELPESVIYNANGYKTVGTMFQNVSFEIPTLDYETEIKIGSLLVSNIRQENDLFIQTEIFFYDNGIAERVIKLENDYSVNTVGGWEIKINRKQDASHIGDFLHVDANGNLAFTRALKDFIVTQNNQTLTENASHFDFSNLFQITASNEDVQIDVASAIKNAFNNAVLDGKKLRFTKVNNNTLEISLPSKLSEYDNDTHFIDKSVNNLENYQKTENVGNKLAVSIDPQTYVLTISLLNSADQVLSSKTVDLPLETMVVSGSYSNGVLRLTLQSGQYIDVPISSLISGLVPETRKINGKPLSDDVNLTPGDVGAASTTALANETEARQSADTALDGRVSAVESGKVDKVTGKGLSENDLTDTLKAGYDDAVTKKHEHSNKSVLDNTTESFTAQEKAKVDNAVLTTQQNLTETQKAQARQNIGAGSANATMVLVDNVPQSSVSFDSDPQQQIAANANERHSHSNKALLDTYSQTEANLADAVLKKHEHSNKSLLDTYAQTETDLADAVTKKHEHSNKSVLDGINSQKVSEWDGKQNALTFDNTPTSNSANPVTSGGVKAALDSKADVEIIDIGNTRIVTNAGSIPDISYATMQSILTALNSAKSVLLQWNFTSPAIYFKVLSWASSGSPYIRIFTSVSTSVQYYISNNAVAYLVGSHADKLGNNTFSGTNNFTGTFQIGGATISYDSATDTFTV